MLFGGLAGQERVGYGSMGAPGGHGMRPNVWTPAGGWFPDPKGWKGNLGKAYLLAGVIGATIFYTSSQLEVRAPHASPTASWCCSPSHRMGFNGPRGLWADPGSVYIHPASRDSSLHLRRLASSHGEPPQRQMRSGFSRMPETAQAGGLMERLLRFRRGCRSRCRGFPNRVGWVALGRRCYNPERLWDEC